MTPQEAMRIYRSELQAHGLTPGRWTTSRKFGPFLRWCEAKSVDPRRFIISRHDAVNWQRAIPPHQLASDKFLAKFREFGDNRAAEEVLQNRYKQTGDPHKAAQAQFPRWSDPVPSPTHEHRRQGWVAVRGPEECADKWPITGGYHPRSRVCPTCPAREQCSTAIPAQVLRSRGGYQG